MSFVYEKPRSSVADTFAGGVASVGDIYAAARESMLYVDNSFAATAAMERAIDERNEEVFAATGFKPVNPLRQDENTGVTRFLFGRGVQGNIRRNMEDWQRSIDEAAARLPDRSVADRLSRSIEGDAIRIARQADEKLGMQLASRPGLTGMAGAFAGAMAGSLRDPVATGSLLIGGGVGAGRTLFTRLIGTAMREAFVNGATEAAMQPMVQAWRSKAGLDSGLDVAMKNVGFAAMFGGVLGGAGHLAAEGLGRLSGRGLDAAASTALTDPRVAEAVRLGLAGDTVAARAQLDTIREALPAAQRGALDHADVLDHLDASRPTAANTNAHDAATIAAHRAVKSGEPPVFKLDENQVARITADLAEGLAVGAPDRPRSLLEFLIDTGGVVDFNGELAAIGVDKVTRARRGKLLRKEGRSLDYAREAAEEAGYIGRAGEMQVTTVADLLDAMDAEMRGNPVYAREDMGKIEQLADIEGERRRIADTVHEIAGYAGPHVDDAVLREAARLSLQEGVDAGDAFERAVMQADLPEGGAHRNGAVLPGWSDDELDALGAPRGAEPAAEPGGPFSNPGKVDPELTGEIVPAEILSWPAEQFNGNWQKAVDFLRTRQTGELTGFLHHKEVGAIDVIWGSFDPATGKGAGLAKIAQKHPEVVGRLPEIVAGMEVQTRSANRIRLHTANHQAVIRLDFDGEQKTWLMTAYDKGRRNGETTDRPEGRQVDGHSSSTSPAGANIGEDVASDKEIARVLADRDAAGLSEMIPTENGLAPLADYLDAIEADEALSALVEACRA